MSTVVFIGEKKPEKNLIQEQSYRYHPDSVIKDKILEDLRKHLNCSLEQYIIDLNIQVILKEYVTKNT